MTAPTVGPAHTSGPWHWIVNRSSHRVELRGAGHLTVMDFVRYGMDSGAPRFRNHDDMGLLSRADELSESVTGREHHESWYRTINHPDAALIASAPTLAADLDEALRVLERIVSSLQFNVQSIDELTGGEVEAKFGAHLAAMDEARALLARRKESA